MSDRLGRGLRVGSFIVTVLLLSGGEAAAQRVAPYLRMASPRDVAISSSRFLTERQTQPTILPLGRAAAGAVIGGGLGALAGGAVGYAIGSATGGGDEYFPANAVLGGLGAAAGYVVASAIGARAGVAEGDQAPALGPVLATSLLGAALGGVAGGMIVRSGSNSGLLIGAGAAFAMHTIITAAAACALARDCG